MTTAGKLHIDIEIISIGKSHSLIQIDRVKTGVFNAAGFTGKLI